MGHNDVLTTLSNMSNSDKRPEEKTEPNDPRRRVPDTWPEREKWLKDKILGNMSPDELAYFLELERDAFEREQVPMPAVERRIRALEAVLEPKTPAQRERFLQYFWLNGG